MAEEMIESQVESPAGSDGAVELNDTDSLADYFDQMDGEDGGEGEAGDADGADGTEGADGSAEGAEGHAPEEQAAPEHPMPEGWEEGMWNGLTPEVRAHIAGRAQAHAQALAAERKAMADLRAQQEQFSVQADAQMRQALATMQHVVEGEFAQVNWQELANNDPAMYVRLQQLYASRMNAVKQVEQGIAQRVEQMRAAQKQREDAALETEYRTSLPEIKALFGAGFEGRRFVRDMADYMTSNGVPAEAVNGMSRGYELKFVAKAMLYDKLMSQRAAAARKVAEAPKVQAPRGAAQDVTGNRLAKARKVLSRNPNSTDALAAVFDAM